MGIIDYFDLYTNEYDWKIIPIFSRSKIPVTKKWHSSYNCEWSRFYIETHPNVNIGLLLGKIVDVEGDTPESNTILKKLLEGNKHPTYCSSKSIHHLFISPDPKLTCLKFDGIEFRGNKHYSVVPPSIHAGGVSYKWITDPKCGIPEMPNALRDLYESNKKKNSNIKPGFVIQTCPLCKYKQPIHEKRLKLEIKAFEDSGLNWSCRYCRHIDVRKTCRLIRRQINLN